MPLKKHSNDHIIGEKIYLRDLTLDDVQPYYRNWLNDPTVTQYLNTRFAVHTLDTLRCAIEDLKTDKNNVFLAIMLKHNERHIGVVKLGPIDRTNKTSVVSVMIGEKDCWGKGYGTEAIQLICQLAFRKLELNKVTADCYEPNVASGKALQKAGFTPCGTEKNQISYERLNDQKTSSRAA